MRRCLAVTILFCLQGLTVFAQTADDTALRQRAIDLYRQSKYLESLPLFEKLVVIFPNDALMHEGLGVALVSQASTLAEKDSAPLRKRGREEFLLARKLGDTSDLVAVELEMLPPDGALPPISEKPEAQQAMGRAEACFARQDLDCAISEYETVLKYEPRQYEAALFIGDCYFRKQDLEDASKWFNLAITIDPGRETAYRYWADAFMQADKNDQAREKFIEAFITVPYMRATQAGLRKWADHNLVKLQSLSIQSPNRVTEKDGKININIDADTMQHDDGRSAWIVCAMSHALWQKETFQKRFPNEKQYRHSLAEEAECLDLTATSAAQQVKNKSAKHLDPALAVLIDLQSKGLIEAYVLLNGADEGIARDFVAYRDAHRDKLRQYVSEYMLVSK